MPVSLSLRKQTTFCDVLTGSPPPPRKWRPRNKHTNLPFTDHALLPNYQYEIGLFKIHLKTFGCPTKILHISIVSLLGLTITSTEIENKEYYGIFGKAYFCACSLEVILQGNH